VLTLHTSSFFSPRSPFWPKFLREKHCFVSSELLTPRGNRRTRGSHSKKDERYFVSSYKRRARFLFIGKKKQEKQWNDRGESWVKGVAAESSGRRESNFKSLCTSKDFFWLAGAIQQLATCRSYITVSYLSRLM
jgi:hypothetical protein